MKKIYLLFIALTSIFICNVAVAIMPNEISEEMEMNDTLAPFVKYTFTSDCDVDGVALDEPWNDPENRSNMSSLMMDISQSYNYTFQVEAFEKGVDSIVNWSLRRRDYTLNARAVLMFFDVAGNRRDIIINCLSTASVDDLELSNSINLFNDNYTLHFYSDNDYIVDEIMIYNLTGELVLSEKVNQAINMFSVKIADLNRGVYLIKLFINGTWINKKIII
ncbi:MAG: T9SS type A sorting domain-containing protein [Candidatus Kapabacteria bacterium]|nr:T9SS type A sorting domain-containing protein [Candidatus Kapabacteria bacterium]